MGEKEAPFPHGINTGGGAYVGDRVDVDDGDFVGRDKYEFNITMSGKHVGPVFAGVPAECTHLVGRDDLTTSLVGRLTSGDVKALAFEGLPGVGKTALAVALAHDPQIRSHFKDGVLWASLGQSRQADPMGTLNVWAGAFEADISQLLSLEERRQAVQNLIGQRHLLLVIDNAWEIEAAEALRCGGPNCCYLLSTRDESVARAFAGPGYVDTVPELSDDFAFQLLQQLAPEACQADPEKARALAQTVGGLPLAIELLGGYLAAPERSYFPDLSEEALDELADPQHRLELAQSRLGGRGTRLTLQQTIALSLENLPLEAQQAFYALGAFAPKPDHFSRQAAETVAQTDAATLALLARHNLIEIEDKDLTINQTLADVACTQCDESARERHRRYYLDLAKEDRDDWQRIERAYGQIRWAWQFLPQDAVRFDWIQALRVYQRRRGLWDERLAWLESGLEIAQAEGLRRDEGTMLHNIGCAYYDLDKLEESLEYSERARAVREKIGHRIGLARTLVNIGMTYDALGRYEDALDYYQRALPIIERKGNRKWLAKTLCDIGGAYINLGYLEDAREYLKESLSIGEELEDPEELGYTLRLMGDLYAQGEELEKALGYYQHALPHYEELGDLEQEAIVFNAIGILLYGLGYPEQALKSYEEALSRRKTLDIHAEVASTLDNIGISYEELEQWEKALDHYQQAADLMAELGRTDDEIPIRFNIAEIHRQQGRLPEAIAELKRAVELGRRYEHEDLEEYEAVLAEIESDIAS